MGKVWSRKFLPKVFGGVFGTVLFVGATFAASPMEQAAISKATEATLVATGVNAKIKQQQVELERLLNGYAKEYNVQNELAFLGLATKTLRDKRIMFRYRDNVYLVCPNYIEVKIPF